MKARQLVWCGLLVAAGCGAKKDEARPVQKASDAARAEPASAKPAAVAGAKPASDPAQPTPPTPTPTPTPDPTSAVAPTAGKDFIAEARTLYRVAACGSDEAVPAQLAAKVVDSHCKRLEELVQKYHNHWLSHAQPFFQQVVPADAPHTVVYPFGGGDLMTALAIYPDATEFTTISLEPAGDPRLIDSLPAGELRPELSDIRSKLDRLIINNHSRTDNLSAVSKGILPGELIFSLVGLHLHGFEPVALRYFRIEADGSLHYLDDADLGDAKQKRAGGPFDDMELTFRKVGDPSAPLRIHRHIRADLGDDALGKDGRVLKHLEQKGKVAAMTKAASYLLWYDSFNLIRGYLLGHMQWMVSDSTGVPPRWAKPAGFAQTTYGQFDDAFLGVRGRNNDDMKKLWTSNKKRYLGFMFGYPDGAHHRHLMITAPTGTVVPDVK